MKSPAEYYGMWVGRWKRASEGMREKPGLRQGMVMGFERFIREGWNRWLRLRRGGLTGERGATMVEYALIASSIAVVVIASAFYVGTRASDTFETVADRLAAVNNPEPPRPRRP